MHHTHANTRTLLRRFAGAICCAACVLTLGLAVSPAAAQVTCQTRTIDTPDGPCIVHIAAVDLTSPRIEIVVTAPSGVTGIEATLLATDAWAKQEDVDLAINANFFGLLPDPGQKKATGGYTAGRNADIIGLSVSDGVVISHPRIVGGAADPALVIGTDGVARIGPMASLDGVHDAVAGIGASRAEDPAAALLVTDGVNTAAAARVDPAKRHPRTAAGVSADGHTLWLVAADGRQPGYSVGLTLPELAQLFISLGADDALNLDGGGSTAFIERTPEGQWRTNRPSGGSFRPVANHLGVRVRPAVEAAVPNATPQKESTTSSDPR